MNGSLIITLVQKDLALFLRNRFFALISVLSLLIYIAIYFVMPATVSQKFTVAIYPPTAPEIVSSELAKREMAVVTFDTQEAMLAAVEAGEMRVGIVLPDDAGAQFAAMQPMQVTAYYPPGIPAELNRAFNDLLVLVFNEISHTATAGPLQINRHEEVLGYDLAGRQIPPRDRMLPLFAVLLLMMETLALANLITEEVERGTVRALLITPMRLRELFAGKSITGIGLAFVQALLLIAVTGKLGWQPLLILTALLLGALLVTGVGFLIAAVSKDLMSVISWGMLAILLLGVPSMSVMFPGTISGWVQVIPSYYLVDTLHRVINFNAGWADMLPNLAILLVSGMAMLSLGTAVLGRKLR
jgi:ABC-2 type transport system permease protein